MLLMLYDFASNGAMGFAMHANELNIRPIKKTYNQSGCRVIVSSGAILLEDLERMCIVHRQQPTINISVIPVRTGS